jgi:hypothetical protein
MAPPGVHACRHSSGGRPRSAGAALAGVTTPQERSSGRPCSAGAALVGVPFSAGANFPRITLPLGGGRRKSEASKAHMLNFTYEDDIKFKNKHVAGISRTFYLSVETISRPPQSRETIPLSYMTLKIDKKYRVLVLLYCYWFQLSNNEYQYDTFSTGNSASYFVTFSYLIIELPTGYLRICFRDIHFYCYMPTRSTFSVVKRARCGTAENRERSCLFLPIWRSVPSLRSCWLPSGLLSR